MSASTQDRRAMAARMRDGDAENIPEEDESGANGVASSSRRRSGGAPATPGGSKEETRRKEVALRTQLRALDAKTAEQRQSGDGTAADLQDNLVAANKIFNEITRPQEAALEVKAFINTSEIAAKKARALKIDQTAFDTGDFIEAALKIVGRKRMRGADDSDDEDGDDFGSGWATLGWMGARHSARVCLPDFLFGPLAVSMKQRNAVKRAKLVRDEKAKVKPKEIETNGDQDQANTTAYAVEIYARLIEATQATHGAQSSLNFFEFVINPFSFSQTIENIFYVSFHIKAGTAALGVDDDTEMLTILACDPPDATDTEQGVGKMQMVMEIDMDIWRDAIEQYNIRDCIWIPNREIAPDAR